MGGGGVAVVDVAVFDERSGQGQLGAGVELDLQALFRGCGDVAAVAVEDTELLVAASDDDLIAGRERSAADLDVGAGVPDRPVLRLGGGVLARPGPVGPPLATPTYTESSGSYGKGRS